MPSSVVSILFLGASEPYTDRHGQLSPNLVPFENKRADTPSPPEEKSISAVLINKVFRRGGGPLCRVPEGRTDSSSRLATDETRRRLLLGLHPFTSRRDGHLASREYHNFPRECNRENR